MIPALLRAAWLRRQQNPEEDQPPAPLGPTEFELLQQRLRSRDNSTLPGFGSARPPVVPPQVEQTVPWFGDAVMTNLFGNPAQDQTSKDIHLDREPNPQRLEQAKRLLADPRMAQSQQGPQMSSLMPQTFQGGWHKTPDGPSDYAEQAMGLFGPTGPSTSPKRPDLSDMPGRYGVTEQVADKPQETDEQKREARINKLNMIKALAEGSGKIGDAFVEYGDRMARRPIQKARDYTAGIDEAIAKEEDKIPASLTEKLRAAGYTLPEGTTFSQFKQVAPAFSNALDNRTAMARAGQAQANSDRSARQADERLGILKSGEARRNQLAARMPAKQEEEISDLRTALGEIDYLLKKQPEFSTGPIDTPVANLRDMLPVVNSPERANFKSQLADLKSNYLVKITGRVSNSSDQARAIQSTPNMDEQEPILREKLKTLRDIYVRDLQSKIQTLKDNKFDVSRFESGNQSSGSGKIDVISPDGVLGEIPAEQWPEAERSGYRRP